MIMQPNTQSLHNGKDDAIREMPQTDKPEIEQPDTEEMPQIKDPGVENTDIEEVPDINIEEVPDTGDEKEIDIPPTKTA